MLQEKISVRAWVILLLLALTWGSSYVLIKKALIAFSPTQVASLRVTISALAFIPFFIARWSKIDWSRWRALAVVGFTGSFFPAFLFSTAQTEMSSSITGILSSLTPLFTLLIGIVVFRMPTKFSKIGGVLIGLAGAIFLVVSNQGTEEIGNAWYGILIILATACYGMSTNVIKQYLQDMSSITISAVAFMIIGIPGMLFLLSTDVVGTLQTHEYEWQSLGYLTLLALLGTVAASIFFFKLVQITSPIFASMVSYLTPIVAVFWGILDGEAVTIFHWLGMLLILMRVYIARK